MSNSCYTTLCGIFLNGCGFGVGSRSGADCALRCLSNAECTRAAFPGSKGDDFLGSAGADNCVLYLSYRQGATLVPTPGWDVYDVGYDCN